MFGNSMIYVIKLVMFLAFCSKPKRDWICLEFGNFQVVKDFFASAPCCIYFVAG